MKTLLFLLDRYPAFGGVETVTTVLANSLAEHYRIIICSQRGEPEHEQLRRLKPAILFKQLPHTGKRAEIAALDTILAGEGVDVVIYQDSYARNDYLVHHIKQCSRIKLVVAEHSAPSHSRRWIAQYLNLPWWDVYHRMRFLWFNGRGHLHSLRRRSRLYRICDRYVVLSERLKQEFTDNSYIRETSKLCAIGNPVSYPPATHAQGEKKKKQVLFIGQFVPLKGLERLLRIWERVQQQVPEWALVLVGDGPQMGMIQDCISSRRLLRVETAGFRTNIRDYCEASAILCLCSDFEGFPMVLPEAMCSGVVPICFESFSSLADIITNGNNGYSIPPFDEEAFADRLLQLMQNDALRHRMAEAALNKASDFRLDTVTARWRELLEQLF